MLSITMLAILFSGESAMGQTLVSDEHVTLRETATSVLGVPSPGHEDHQIVMALSHKDGDKIWV